MTLWCGLDHKKLIFLFTWIYYLLTIYDNAYKKKCIIDPCNSISDIMYSFIKNKLRVNFYKITVALIGTLENVPSQHNSDYINYDDGCKWKQLWEKKIAVI